MTRNQQIHYRATLWPAACKAQKWDPKDDEKRREVIQEVTGQDSTAKLNNKQVDRLFTRLRWLANPQDFDLAYADANPELADAEKSRERILWRIERAAEKGGFSEAYLAEAAAYKVRHHRVTSWRDLPDSELVNFSKTIHARAAKRAAQAVQQESTQDAEPGDHPF